MSEPGPPPPGWGPPPPPYAGPPAASAPYGEVPEQKPRPAAQRTGLRRWAPVLVGLVGAVLIVGAVVAVPLVVDGGEDPAVTGTRTGVAIEGLQVYDGLTNEHTQKSVDYPQTPPVGGPHDPAWLACGAYDQPLRDENAVHDLEHGSVWIAYDPDLSDDDVEQLDRVLPDNGIMAPYPGLDAPVVLTVWGRQLAVDDVDDERIGVFMQQFGGGEAALEPFVGCQGGITDPSGGEATSA